MKNIDIYVGDCVESMRQLEAGSVQCCVTSPPYFGLRDYGHDGQIGLEQTPDKFVAALVRVFDEVHRVLADDGTLWLNLGDSYSGSGKGPAGNLGSTHNERHMEHKHGGIVPEGLKPKDLIGIPWRVAFALQSAGWYLRQDIIWHKPNPMPESVRDRCTKAHEYIFLLSKSPKYYYDHESVKEEAIWKENRPSGMARNGKQYRDKARGKYTDKKSYGGSGTSFAGHSGNYKANGELINPDGKRNKRSVWTVTTKPYKGAHFATFPPDLIEPCILAGCPKGGTVLDPFGGSGTTAGVAVKHGRRAIICELNPEYAKLIPDRVKSIYPQIEQADIFE